MGNIMKHFKMSERKLAATAAACLLCFSIAQAGKPDNCGGGGGKKSAYTTVDLHPGGAYTSSEARSVNDAAIVVGVAKLNQGNRAIR